ncbi:MAG: hypothetical protein ACRC8F_04080 [Cetobacterium sp.]
MQTKVIKTQGEYVVDTKNCVFEVIATENEKGYLSKLWVTEPKVDEKEGNTLLYLDIEKTCLGILVAVLPLYDITIEKV